MSDDSTKLDGLDRRRVLQGLGAAGAVGIAGCSGGGGGGSNANTNKQSSSGTSSGGGSTGGEMTIAQAKSPIKFDPIVLNDVPSAQITEQVFDGLYTYGKDVSKFVPVIADGQPKVSNGGKTYKVSLNKDAKFQNGDPVTAEDVKYTFLAPVKEKTPNASEVKMIDSIDTPDKHTVVFHLKYPYGAFMTSLTFNVVSKKVREKDKQAYAKKKPVGAGPFTFEEFKQGDHVTVKAWDKYWWKQKPKLGTVRFKPIKEQTTRVTTLKTGKSDMIVTVPPKLWDKVKQMGNADITAVPGISYFYLAFNCNAGPTADPKVRQAIGHAFSMDDAVKRYVEPSGVRQYSPLPKKLATAWDMPLDKWKGMAPKKDVNKAKSMLDGNDNVPNDWSAKIIVPPDKKRKQIGVTVANGLKQAGYGANVQQYDWGTFLNKYNTGKTSDYNMFTLGWAGSPDPDAFLYYLFSKEEIKQGANGDNGSYYGNDQVSKWIMQGRQTSDHKTRQEVYQKAVTKILEDLPHFPAYGLKNSFGVANKVQDFKAHPQLYIPLVSSFQDTSIQQS